VLRGTTTSDEVVRDWRVEIPVVSRALVTGHTAGSLGIARTREYELITVVREGEMLGPEVSLEAGDGLVFMATETGVRALWGSPFFGTSPDRLYAVTVRSGSGTEVRELEDGALHVVAARSATPLRDTHLPPGDLCFVSAREVGAVRAHAAVGLWQDAASRVPQPRRTWVAVLILAGVIVSASVGAVPIELAAVAGAVLMVLTRVLRPGQAARAVDLNIIGILAGSIGLGVIVVTSGLADVLADVVRTLSSGEAVLVVVVFALATALMTNVVTNAAAVSILTPVGLTIASEMAIDPAVLLALIGTCVSFTFINPFAHQTNLMVMRPGGYTTATFVRFGLPLIIAVVATAIVAANVLLRL
jgi:hypothetical protein